MPTSKSILKNLKIAATRVPHGSGKIIPFKLNDPYGVTLYRGLEHRVLRKIVRLSGGVRFEVEGDENSPWTERLEESLEFPDSIKRLVQLSLVSNVISLAYIRRAGQITEIKSFNSFTNIKEQGRVDFTDYIEDKTLSVARNDVDQFGSDAETEADMMWSQPLDLRNAEISYWDRWKKLNKLTGFLKTNYEDLLEMYSSAEATKELIEIGDQFAEQNIALVPDNYEFTQVNLPESIKDMEESILRGYCEYYGIPWNLFRPDQQTHSNLSSDMQLFKQECLENILEPIVRAIGRKLEINIKLDLTKFDVLSTKGMLELAQSGLLWQDEGRKIIGFPPLPNGEGQKPIEAAGTPDTQGDKGKNENGQEEEPED